MPVVSLFSGDCVLFVFMLELIKPAPIHFGKLLSLLCYAHLHRITFWNKENQEARVHHMNPRHINSYEIDSSLEVVACGSERSVRWRERVEDNTKELE